MKKIFLTLLFFPLIILVSYSQDFNKAKLDSFFAALENNDKFMGSIALSQNGEIIYAKSIGFSDIENHIKADKNTKYRIGSISKTFTTILVLEAVEEHKLALEQTIENYFPSIENAEKITIEQLLRHRSGIHNFTNDPTYESWNTQPKTEQQIIEIIQKGGSDFEPDSKAQYSNSNFILLTYILEKTFQKSYAELLTQYITEPLGLKHTRLGGKINPVNNEAKSYAYNGEWMLQPETDISIPLGAGGIISTPSDLVLFSDALFDGKLLKPESLEQMKTLKDNYGMGLFQFPFYNKTGYGHNGGIDGFSSVFTHFPDGNISYALTSNGTNYNNNNISIAVLSAVYGQDFQIPEFTSFEVKSEDLDKYQGIYSSIQIPLKITISKQNNVLLAQASGQPVLALEATAENKFKNEQAAAIFEFEPANNTLILKQKGAVIKFTKEQ